MSMTPDAGSYFQPLQYTTSFTNPALYNNASSYNLFNQSQDYLGDLLRRTQASQQETGNRIAASQLALGSLGYSQDGSGGGGGGGGASPYQTSANVWETGAAPFIGGGGSSGFGGSIYGGGGFGGLGGFGSLGASPYQTTPNVFETGARAFGSPGAGAIDWGNLFKTTQNFPQANANLGAGLFGGLGGTGAMPKTGQQDWTRLYPSGGARTDPFPNMAQPGGLNQPMVTPQQQPQDFGSLFGKSVGGTAGAPSTPQPAAPSFDVAGKTAQPSLTDYGATPSLDFTRLFGGDKATAAPGATSRAAPEPTPSAVPAAGGGRSFSDYYYNPDLYAPSAPQAGAAGGSLGGAGAASGETQRTPGAEASALAEQARSRLASIIGG